MYFQSRLENHLKFYTIILTFYLLVHHGQIHIYINIFLFIYPVYQNFVREKKIMEHVFIDKYIF